MKKIPCLFQRDFSSQRRPVLLDAVTPGCERIMAGEGMATRKWDGTACLVKDGKLYARYDAKAGKTPPEGSIPCEPAPDPMTGHWPHWVLVAERLRGATEEPPLLRPQYKHHVAAWEASMPPLEDDGSYELCGPHFQGNPQHLETDTFIRHGEHRLIGFGDRSFERLRDWFLTHPTWEGIVFWLDSAPHCKIRRDDYGLPWPVPASAEAGE